MPPGYVDKKTEVISDSIRWNLLRETRLDIIMYLAWRGYVEITAECIRYPIIHNSFIYLYTSFV